MRILVTGAGGQLGTDLGRLLTRSAAATPGDRSAGLPGLSGWQQLARSELDVTDGTAVRSVVRDQARAAAGDLVVVNAAAWTDVDLAESREEEAYAINATGVAHLAAACAAVSARLVHVSTDYVFPGTDVRGGGRAPYEPDEAPSPRGAYGRTKLAGEQAVAAFLPSCGYVVRTAWLYRATGDNFVTTMVRLEGERETVDVVADQRGSPTWSADLAAGLLDLVVTRPKPGVYHAVNAGSTTRFGLARAVFEELGADPRRVRPTTADALARPAPRPAYSVLSTRTWQAAGLRPLRPWREALRLAMAQRQGLCAGAAAGFGTARPPG